MTTILEMPVRLYSSPEQMAAGTPEWTGSLDDFWSKNQHAYTWGEMRVLADELTSTGFHRGGGGASPEFWLVRGSLGPMPDALALAETSSEDDATIRDLIAALEATLSVLTEVNARHPFGQGGYNAMSNARALLAKHGRG